MTSNPSGYVSTGSECTRQQQIIMLQSTSQRCHAGGRLVGHARTSAPHELAPSASFACCASSRLHDQIARQSHVRLNTRGARKGGRRERGTHCRAAKIICALRSRRLASRFSAESSQTAFLPASSGSALADVTDVRASRWYRVMRLSCFFVFDGPAAAAL